MAWNKVKDFVQEWRYQLFYFTFYAGYMPLLLYLPVYLKHVGLTSVQIGILNGLRPILQSLATPLLVIVSEKFRSNKLLFVLSCFIAVGKILIMFLLMRPQRQLCTIDYVNNSNVAVWEVSRLVHVSLMVDDGSRGEQNIVNRRAMITGKDFDTKNKLIPKFPTVRKFVSEENYPEYRTEMRKNLTKTGRDLKEVRGLQSTQSSDVNANLKGRNEQESIRTKFKIIYNENELYRIFTALIFLTLVADPFIAAIFTLVDYSCVANTEAERGYREVRLWETIGWGTMTPITGFIMYELSNRMCGILVETFHYMFFFFIAFTTLALIIGIQIDFTRRLPELISTKIRSGHSNLQYCIFSIISAFTGFGHGFLFTFINWFIDTLGGTTVIMGTATAMKAIVDIILYFSLGRLVEKVGYVATGSIGLVGHLLVFVIYYWVANAWLVILVETMYAVVYGSLMSTAASFLVNVAPAGSSTRLQGMLYYKTFWYTSLNTHILCEHSMTFIKKYKTFRSMLIYSYIKTSGN